MGFRLESQQDQHFGIGVPLRRATANDGRKLRHSMLLDLIRGSVAPARSHRLTVSLSHVLKSRQRGDRQAMYR